MYKSWKGEFKDKQDQRTKGTNPFDARDNKAQYSKEMLGESKMAETARKKQPYPVKCWNYGGDHHAMHFLKKGNKEASMYNVQEPTIVEDVSRSIP